MKSRLLFWALVALIGLAAVVDAARYRAVWQMPQPLPPALPNFPALAEETPPSPLKEALARPLFWEYRRPLRSATAGAEKIPLARGELLALFASANQRVALVAIPEQGVWRITDQSGPRGCRLTAVAETRAEFQCGAERITLPLTPRPLSKPKNDLPRAKTAEPNPQSRVAAPPSEGRGRYPLEKPR